MKKIIIATIMLLSAFNVNAQSVVKNGNVYSYTSSSSRTTSKDTLVTKFQFADSKGTKYPIIINRNSGRCYIWKLSGKTGKPYKMYMKEELSRAICKELGVKYVESKK